MGIMAGEPSASRAPSWERVRLCVDRVEAQLLRVITRAAIVPRRADQAEVSAAIVSGMEILNTRDGHDIPAEHLRERAVNTTQILTFTWDVFEPAARWSDSAEGVGNHPTSGSNPAKQADHRHGPARRA